MADHRLGDAALFANAVLQARSAANLHDMHTGEFEQQMNAFFSKPSRFSTKQAEAEDAGRTKDYTDSAKQDTACITVVLHRRQCVMFLQRMTEKSVSMGALPMTIS